MGIMRKDYMEGRATHREYYAQFVDPILRGHVARFIGKDRILASTDPHFNDIPLKWWDNLAPMIRSLVGAKIQAAGTGGVSLSDTVCVAKEAARQIKEEAA